MTNISTATSAELRQTVRNMRSENLDVSTQLDLISADIIGMDPVTYQHNGGNTDPDQMATIRAGRLMVRCAARNAARLAAKFRTASKRAPARSALTTQRSYPKFQSGMSTSDYVQLYTKANCEPYNTIYTLPYNLTDYATPCTLYEGGALDFDAIEEPIDAPERTEPEPTRTPEPMVQIVSGLTGAYLGLLPKSAAHAMAQRHGNTIGTPAPADYTITAARYSKTGAMVIKTHSPDGYSTRASRLAATFGRYSHRQGGYTVTAKAAARFSAMYAAGWDGSYISDKAADRKPPAANQTAEAARQVSELIASATTAATIEHASDPTTEDDHQDATEHAGELATVDAAPCAMATTCDASSASSAGSAPAHGHAGGHARRNIWIPNMKPARLDRLLSKIHRSSKDIEDLKDFKHFLLTDQTSAEEKGFFEHYSADGGNIAVLKNKFWLTNIDAAIEQGASHQAPQRATHDANGQRIGQHVAGHSGNWCAVMFRDDCGRPAFEFDGQDGSREVWSFETCRERMAALQAMAREADDAADQSNDASDADQPPAEQAGIESIKDAIRMNEREMERVLKSKQKGSKESAYRIELIISELADKLSDALKASKSTTTTGEYQQPAPVPKTETEADTKAADKVPRAVATDFDNDHTANEAAAADATAGDATEHTDTTADEFERAAPQAFDMLAMIAAGMAPAEFVGLGIVYSGDMANPRGRGAITSMEANAWRDWIVRVELEDGRLFTCDPLSFKESIGNRFKTDFKRHGTPYLAELEAARLAAEASRKAAKQAAADEKDRQRRELPQQWPQLKVYDPAGKLSGCTLAAANIRILLKEKFPGVKFSVKTSKFSGGDDINVSWTDGPAQKDVEAIADLFSAGSFDGMEDIYNYRHSVFTDLFGDAKYIFCNRDISPELLAQVIADEWPNPQGRPTVEDYQKARGEFDFIDQKGNRRRIEERLNRMGWNFKS